MSKKKPKQPSGTIALNKKAKHEYELQDKFEAGIALQGWEVKSLREGKVQIVDTYVLLQNGEASLPLITSPNQTAAANCYSTNGSWLD